MNERIEQLVEQADNIEILPDEEFCDTDFLADIDPRRVKKFAELIVRECMEQVWYTREDGINGNISEVIKERMKQHFGVES